MSRICQEIDQQVQAFLARPLESSGYAYVYLDATYLKGRLGKALQVCSSAVVVALGVNEDGRRELLGLKVGDSETETFWVEFMNSIKERGLARVRLVVSDAHTGLTKAICRQLQGRRMFSAESMAGHPGSGRYPRPAERQRLRSAARRPQVIRVVAPHRAQRLGSPPGPGRCNTRLERAPQPTTHPRSDERLDKSIVPVHRGCKRRICTSGMTARHSTLFTL